MGQKGWNHLGGAAWGPGPAPYFRISGLDPLRGGGGVGLIERTSPLPNPSGYRLGLAILFDA